MHDIWQVGGSKHHVYLFSGWAIIQNQAHLEQELMLMTVHTW